MKVFYFIINNHCINYNFYYNKMEEEAKTELHTDGEVIDLECGNTIKIADDKTEYIPSDNSL